MPLGELRGAVDTSCRVLETLGAARGRPGKGKEGRTAGARME
jgi:hypothetical protein